MAGGDNLDFEIRPASQPVPAVERAALMANPGFGRVFTDHMVTIRYADTKGWYDARVEPRAPIALDPATAVLHYAQEIFEGLKAYRTADGGVITFRADANARRFRESATRMAMPHLPDDLFLGSIRELVSVDRDWVPTDPEGSLYLRPFMFASEVFLGVKPSAEYLYVLIASASGRTSAAARSRSRSGSPASTPGRRPAEPARPSAVATTPRAWSPRRRRPRTAASRWCSWTRWRTPTSTNWAG